MFKSKFVAVAALSACAAAIGCSGAGSSSSSPVDDSSGEQALSAVRSCASRAHSCADGGADDAGSDSCTESYHSCLARLEPDGGFGFSFRDGGRCDRDGSFGSFGIGDGGLAVVSAVDSCLQDLATCVHGTSTPETCAMQAVTCLESALGLPSTGSLWPEDAGAAFPPPHTPVGSWTPPSAPTGSSPFPFPSFDAGIFGSGGLWGHAPEADAGRRR